MVAVLCGQEEGKSLGVRAMQLLGLPLPEACVSGITYPSVAHTDVAAHFHLPRAVVWFWVAVPFRMGAFFPVCVLLVQRGPCCVPCKGGLGHECSSVTPVGPVCQWKGREALGQELSR